MYDVKAFYMSKTGTFYVISAIFHNFLFLNFCPILIIHRVF